MCTSRIIVGLWVLVLFVSACFGGGGTVASDSTADAVDSTQVAGGSCGLDLPQAASAEESLRALLSAEGELLVAQDIDPLMQLWAETSRIIDAKNTRTSDNDDQVWDGKDAIRHRYVRTVFPGAPASAQPADLEIIVRDDQAEVLATTQIGSEVSPQGDRWTMVHIDGCWYLESLTYNLEPPP